MAIFLNIWKIKKENTQKIGTIRLLKHAKYLKVVYNGTPDALFVFFQKKPHIFCLHLFKFGYFYDL